MRVMYTAKFGRLKSSGPKSFPWKQRQEPAFTQMKGSRFNMDKWFKQGQLTGESLKNKVLEDTLTKMTQGQTVEDAIKNTVTILKKENPGYEKAIDVAGVEIKGFVAHYSETTIYMVAGSVKHNRQF